MKSLPYNKLIITLLIIVIILSVFSIASSYKTGKTNLANLENNDNLSWEIAQTQNGEVDVFLSGPTASNATALDLGISFDKRIKISSVEPGGFFVDPIKTKFDNKNHVYSLMTNPDSKVGNDLTKPVFRFILSPDVLTGYNFSILPTSLVYLQDIGGAYPVISQIILK